MAYIRAVEPGPPPYGWRDITPYFGGIPSSLGSWKRVAAEHGYYVTMQQVVHNGQRYRRVAVVLQPIPGKPRKR